MPKISYEAGPSDYITVGEEDVGKGFEIEASKADIDALVAGASSDHEFKVSGKKVSGGLELEAPMVATSILEEAVAGAVAEGETEQTGEDR